ncbi:hypothetical protein Pfo_026666 [Paulownia fortunei]|nr:hypothetical protein Pfo_026666 [Paulownia fortunei]
MKVQVESRKLINRCTYSFKVMCIFLIIQAGATSSKKTKCPFQYLYHFGDGITDIGNSIRVLPYVFDSAADFGLPHITSFSSINVSTSYDGVIFSVARSPVLDSSFFKRKGIILPPYAVSLHDQLSWFKTYLTSICSTPTARLQKSLILMGDIEGNDIGYSLTQGKSIKQVKTYVPFVIRAIIKATRLIKMGATLVVIPGNGPLGCYPYILTALHTKDSKAYDELGCLKNVNDLILSKNNDLQKAIRDLNRKFPNVTINFGNFYKGVIDYLRQVSSGNTALKACCGIGGKYNYDSKRFCGSPRVPVCRNPKQYVYWDGLHFTQEAYARIEHILIQPALSALNCTSKLSSFM